MQKKQFINQSYGNVGNDFQAVGIKKQFTCGLLFICHKAGMLGLGDGKSPTSSCPCIYRYKWYNKNVQKIQNKNVQLIYCYPGGKQYDFTKQHYYKLRN